MADRPIDPEVLKRYLEGKSSPEEALSVALWYRQIEHGETPPELDQPLHLSRIKERIAGMEASQKEYPLRRTNRGRRFTSYGIAASLALLLIAFPAYFTKWKIPATDNIRNTTSTVTVLSNTESRIIKYQLPDDSFVWLHPQARLHFDNSLFSSANRRVILSGEAFFDITRDAANPFVVEMGDMRVKVLGTSFLVRQAEKQGSYEVAVVSGKVQVYSEKHTKSELSGPVVLNPAEKASYHMETGSVTASKLSPSDHHVDTWQPADLLFDDTRLDEVARQLQLKFGLEVRFENKDLANCMLKASFENHRLAEVLDAMSEMLELTYEIRQKQIVLRGSGCAEHT